MIVSLKDTLLWIHPELNQLNNNQVQVDKCPQDQENM